MKRQSQEFDLINSMRHGSIKSSSFTEKDDAASRYSNATAQVHESDEDIKETTNDEQTTKVSIEIQNGIPMKTGNKKKARGNALVLHNYKVSDQMAY